MPSKRNKSGKAVKSAGSSTPPEVSSGKSNDTSDDWQNRNGTLGSCLSHMLKNQMETDVEFIVGENRDHFSCHKLILASRSEVFHAMFYGPMAEGNEVVLPDIKPEGFKKLLGYVQAM